ncbi:MAG: ribonuclease III [Oscillospiraceae bacterium]|nr:ribonuclease III [Oscillospiraceae bacterium]
MTSKQYSPIALAFLGDGVFELMVRERLLESGTMKANTLHSLAVERVNAGAQARAYHALEEALTPQEADILKRGRNANTAKTPKNMSVTDYRKATGIEALFGWLYLRGEHARIRVLFDIVWGA